METTITVEEINTDCLSAKALALVSEFALILYRDEGTIIDVHADDALCQLFKSVGRITHERLLEIVKDLRIEISSKTAAQAALTAISRNQRKRSEAHRLTTSSH